MDPEGHAAEAFKGMMRSILDPAVLERGISLEGFIGAWLQYMKSVWLRRGDLLR